MANKKVYKTDPIVEALIDFRFTDFSENLVDFVLASKILSSFSTEYTGETREQKSLSATFKSESGDQSLSTRETRQRLQVLSTDGSKIVSIGTGNLAISSLRPYCGWEELKRRTEDALTLYLSLSQSKELQRVGLRYINRFSVPDHEPNPEHYLKEVSGFHAFAGAELADFYSRTERNFDNGIKLIVNQLNQVGENGPELVLDLDLIADGRLKVEIPDMLEIAESLHSQEKTCFETLITDEARAIFDA